MVIMVQKHMTAGGRFISYLRVSTARQGRSGLGLEAQRTAVAGYLNGGRWRHVAELVEVESGAKGEKDRPKLAEALALCRAYRAPLVIAKLDRLSRNVAFLAMLMDGDVDFVACDFPDANRLTLHILAAVAEHERRMISDRTKAALAAARPLLAAKGKSLGGFRGHCGTAADAAVARAARSLKAAKHARSLAPVLERLDPHHSSSLRSIANLLNSEGIPTPSGGGDWSAATVARIRQRLATPEAGR